MERRISNSKNTKPVLSSIELTGNPEAIASCYCDIGSESKTRLISVPRASSIYDCCVRFHSIGYKCQFPDYSITNVASRIVFSLGNGIHSWLQNTSDVLGMNRVGWWRCKSCGNRLWQEGPVETSCPTCGAFKEAREYDEHNLSTKSPYLSTGHPDMFINVDGFYRVVEVKTIAGDAFDKLFLPLIEHKWQIQHYMWGCSSDNTLPVQIDPGVGYILYISKKPSWKTLPYKMFVEVKDTNILRGIKKKLSDFTKSLKEPHYTPPLKECLESGWASTKAKWCSMKGHCRGFYEEGS
jgi:predicted RNA-binding Zn-ribbon protein involved in translation (DUF1610 family)